MNRDTRIDIRTTPEEKHTILTRARQHNYTASAFVRECGLHGRVQPVPSINAAQWARLAGAMSNMNQLVRLSNKGTVSPDLMPEARRVLAMLKEIRSDLKAARREK